MSVELSRSGMGAAAAQNARGGACSPPRPRASSSSPMAVASLTTPRAVQAFEADRAVVLAVPGVDGAFICAGRDFSGKGGVLTARADSRGALTLEALGSEGALMEQATALAVSADGRSLLVASTSSNTVSKWALGLPDLSLGDTNNLHTAPLPIRALAFNATGDMTVRGGDEMVLSFTAASGAEFTTKVGRAIKAVAFQPGKGGHLGVTTREGSFDLYSVSSTGAALVRRWEALKTADTSDLDGAVTPYPLAWHPTGEAVAVCTDRGAVIIAPSSKHASGWDVVHTLRSPVEQPPTLDCRYGTTGLVWSPNGRYLAAADGRRVLTVWDVLTPNTGVDGKPLLDPAGVPVPAVALQAHLTVCDPADEEGGASGSRDAAVPVSLPPTYPSIACLAWSVDGTRLAYLDKAGVAGTVSVEALARGGPHLSAAAEVDAAAFSWPLAAPGAPKKSLRKAGGEGAAAAASDDDDDAAFAALMEDDEDDAAMAAAATAPAPAPAAAAPAPPAASSSGSEISATADFDAAVAAAAAKAAAAPAAAPAAAARAAPSSSAMDDEMSTNLLSVKAHHGYEESDEVDENGITILKRVGEGGAAAGAADADAEGDAVAGTSMRELVARGKLLTQPMLPDIVRMAGKYVMDVFGLTAPQPPFQPGSTRFGANKRRFLCWNQFGAITMSVSASGIHTIAVDLQDVSKGRSTSFSPETNLTLAALSPTAAVLASPYRPPVAASPRDSLAVEQGTASRVFFMSVSSEHRWSAVLPMKRPHKPLHAFPSLPSSFSSAVTSKLGAGGDDSDVEDADEGTGARTLPFEGLGLTGMEEDDEVLRVDTRSAAESVVGLAVGDGWVAAATNHNLLRIFRSGNGLQELPIAVPGAVVAVAGLGALLAVAYHTGLPVQGVQKIAVDVFLMRYTAPGLKDAATGLSLGTILPRQLCGGAALPLPPDAHLQWLGFAGNGTLCAHSSTGMLYGLQAGLGWFWSPLCDTHAVAAVGGPSAMQEGKKPSEGQHDKRDCYWPVAVVQAPLAAAPSAFAADKSNAAAIKDLAGLMTPTLQAVLCKAATRQPSASGSVRPLVDTIPLQLPLATTGYEGFDDLYLRHEAARVQRGWAVTHGLSSSSGASLTATAATAAALESASTGMEVDPKELLLADLRREAEADRDDAKALDRLVLYSMSATLGGPASAGSDARAAQLAQRLHGDKSLNYAYQYAAKASRGMVGAKVRTLQSARETEGAFMGALPPASAHVNAAVAAAAAASDIAGSARSRAAASAAAASSSGADGFGLGGGAGGSRSGSPDMSLGGAGSLSLGGVGQIGGGGTVATASKSSAFGSRGGAAAAAAEAAQEAVAASAAAAFGGAASAPAPAFTIGDADEADEVAATGGNASNPFAKRAFASPSRPKRRREGDGLDALITASPSGRAGSGGAGLNRQSSFASEARVKRMKLME